MDPKLLALLRARQQQGQPQGGQPQSGQPQDAENPQEQAQPGDQGEDFSLGSQFDQNPFSKFMGQGAGQSQGAQGAQSGAALPPDIMAKMPGMQENQMLKGQGVGASKYLMSAIQALQGYIAESQDPDEIETGRSIVKLLLSLMHAEQEKMSKKLPQDAQAAQAYQGQ